MKPITILIEIGVNGDQLVASATNNYKGMNGVASPHMPDVDIIQKIKDEEDFAMAAFAHIGVGILTCFKDALKQQEFQDENPEPPLIVV